MTEHYPQSLKSTCIIVFTSLLFFSCKMWLGFSKLNEKKLSLLLLTLQMNKPKNQEQNNFIQTSNHLGLDICSLPAQQEPVWFPILTQSSVSGKCLILKDFTASIISREMSAIIPTQNKTTTNMQEYYVSRDLCL